MAIYRITQTSTYYVYTTSEPTSGFVQPDLTNPMILANVEPQIGSLVFGARSCEYVMTPAVGSLPNIYCEADTPDANTPYCTLHGGT